MRGRYVWKPCLNCGQVVAWANFNGTPGTLHKHRYSKKCRLAGERLRAAAKGAAR